MDTKRKRTHESSLSEALQDGGIDALLATVAENFKSMEATVSEISSQIQKQAVQIQKLRKQAVKDRGLALVNEFVGFVSQVHGTGMQQKFVPGYQTGKFNKLRTNQNFGNDCLVLKMGWYISVSLRTVSLRYGSFKRSTLT